VGPGGTNSLTKSGLIVATNPPPVVDFEGAPTKGFVPLTVSFTNLTASATSFAWQFGDGKTSADEHPTNTYTNAGAYTVTLAAMGPGGTNSLTRTNYIVISNLPKILSPALSGDDFTFSFETLVGMNYKVEFKDSLDDPGWQTLQVIPGDGSAKTITNSGSAAPQRFLRLRVE
jgi:PKD repeat protein